MRRGLHLHALRPQSLGLLAPLCALVALVAFSSCAEDDRAPALRSLPGSGGGAVPPGFCDDGLPRPGCPCSGQADGTRVSCGMVEEQIAGQTTCGYGESVCTGGVWGECIINNVSLLPQTKPRTLGPPSSCSDNPCNPYCQTFNDDPNGEGDPSSGITQTDGGLTLPLGDSGGYGDPLECVGGAAGSCVHHMCETGGPLAPGCEPEPAPAGNIEQVLFEEPFADNGQGWSLDSEWEIGPATASSNHQYGHADPADDHTGTADRGVAGVRIGGNAATSTHGYRWLTSPVIDVSATTTPITLRFWRWLNSDYTPYMRNAVQIYDGSVWNTIWQTGGSPGVRDSSWTLQSFDVSAYANAQLRVRFGFRIDHSSVRRVASWNIDDVTITGMVPALPPHVSCVTRICNDEPSCCTTAWTTSCVARVWSTCGAECANRGGECVSCYEDGYDHDLDGTSSVQGDCLDCDPNVNPGAFDYPGNGVDEDCNGIVDDEAVSCGEGLAMASDNPWDYARAIDLCRVEVDPAAEGASRTWGVTAARLVGANGSAAVHALSKGIHTQFGSSNTPYRGPNMAVFSSGAARAPGNPGYVAPNGNGLDQGLSCAYPPGFPQNAAGCPNSSGSAYDSTGLELQIRAPTNAHSFSYTFQYFSSEYPEWVCTAYNDHFVALLSSSGHNGNISFDANSNPVSVNIGFFDIPGCSTCTDPALTLTGFDGSCLCPTSGNPKCVGGTSQTCGGSTGWLYTTAPVSPGEDLTIRFSTWDQGDHKWDSTVLLDNWTWSVQAASVETGVQPPAPPPPVYTDGWFTRDYDASGVCPSGTAVVWMLWSWTASTPSDARIAFHVSTADSAAGLETATEVPLRFTDPPGPASEEGQPAVAQSAVVPDTQAGSATVDETLLEANLPRSLPLLRIRSHLMASTDGFSAPTLQAWNLQFDCRPDE